MSSTVASEASLANGTLLASVPSAYYFNQSQTFTVSSLTFATPFPITTSGLPITGAITITPLKSDATASSASVTGFLRPVGAAVVLPPQAGAGGQQIIQISTLIYNPPWIFRTFFSAYTNVGQNGPIMVPNPLASLAEKDVYQSVPATTLAIATASTIPDSSASITGGRPPIASTSSTILTDGSTPSGSISSSSSSGNKSHSRSKNISTGEVVGIAIGVAIIAAIIASMLTFCVLRRRRRKTHSDSNGYVQAEKHHDLRAINGNVSKSPSNDRTNITPTVDDYLPRPADDKEIQQRSKTILDQIEMFVQNFCQKTPRNSSRPTSAKTISDAFAPFESPYLTASADSMPLGSSIWQAKDATPFIKHTLAYRLTKMISPASAGDPKGTLLPPEFAILTNSSGSQPPNTDSEKSGTKLCQSQWRALTAHLRTHPSSPSSSTLSPDQTHTISQAVSQFKAAFSPWFKPRYSDEECILALETLYRETARLGVWLVSQPMELVFSWPDVEEEKGARWGKGGKGKKALALTPALLKVTDERGRRLDVPQTLVDASVCGL